MDGLSDMPDSKYLPEKIRQPNSKSCFACGLENHTGLHLRFDITAPGEVTSIYSVPPQFQGFPGVVHGGIIAAMLDEVCWRAPMGVDHPRFMFTARLEVRYRKNVPVETSLRIVGRVVKSKSRTATTTGAIYGPAGDLLAEADALLVEASLGALSDADLEALGWKVYTDEEDKP
jgi:acyl-coenzyme A thioesterase PaaI-like protein